MVVEVPLHLAQMERAASVEGLRDCLAEFYRDSPVVSLLQVTPDELLLRRSMPPSDRLDLWVCGSSDGRQARLVARLDNLGKGASGAAVQNLNLMAGLAETAGLAL
jgi:N-acetyl-gamma-glutamyl-phosphate reductase